MARFAVPLFDLRAAHRELGAALDAVWARLRDAAAHTLGPEVEAFETDFARRPWKTTSPSPSKCTSGS